MAEHTAERNPRFLRLLQMVRALSVRRMGISASEMARLTGVSRASVYRDFEALEACGYALSRREVNGEVRLTLEAQGAPLPENAPPLDARLAYEALRALYFAPLSGLEAVDALDAHFRRQVLRAPQALRGPERATTPRPAVVAMRRALGTAMAEGRRVRLVTRDPRANADVTAEVDPKGWRLVRGQPYLLVCSPESGASRLVKGRRIVQVEVLADLQADVAVREPALGAAPDAAYDEAFEAVVAFPGNFGELLAEYPLNDRQAVRPLPDGRLAVYAPCTNLMGAVRWALGWGGDAEALAPTALRAAVAREALAMSARYRAGGETTGLLA